MLEGVLVQLMLILCQLSQYHKGVLEEEVMVQIIQEIVLLQELLILAEVEVVDVMPTAARLEQLVVQV
jgi:hypothetical protein